MSAELTTDFSCRCRLWVCLTCLVLGSATLAHGQDTDGIFDADTSFVITVPETATPVADRRVADFAEYDPPLQKKLQALLKEQHLLTMCREQRLGIAVADICDLERPRYAGVNDHVMMYAASLPKIAILLTAFELMEKGELPKTRDDIRMLTAMIRESSNADATRAIAKVGFFNIQKTVTDPRYQFYRSGIGGLWVGKPYSKAGTWKRDPIKHLAHAATAHAAARFYYLLERGELVSSQASAEMKEILSHPALHHKFVQGLETQSGRREIFRKSGTWKFYHSDSALIKHNGHTYIAVALTESTRGEIILQNLIVGIDKMITRLHTAHGEQKAEVRGPRAP